MTKREFMQAVIANVDVEEVKTYAESEIAKMDELNEKRRNSVSKKAEENAKLARQIAEEHLSDEPVTATQIGELMDISTQKASALLRMAVSMDLAVKQDVKIKGKGTQKGYTKAQYTYTYTLNVTKDGYLTRLFYYLYIKI